MVKLPRLEALDNGFRRRNCIAFTIENARKFGDARQNAGDVLQAEKQDVATIVAVRRKCRGRCRIEACFGVADDGGVVAEAESNEGAACERDVVFDFLVGVFGVSFIASDEVLSAGAIDGAAEVPR